MIDKQKIEERHKKLESFGFQRPNGKRNRQPKGKISWKPQTKVAKRIKENQKTVSVFRKNNEFVNRFQDELISNVTPQENMIRELLSKHNFDFDFQKPIKYKKHLFFVDFYFPKENIVLEIDGGYHNTKAQKEKDRKRENRIKQVLACKFIRFNNETIDKNLQYVFETVCFALNLNS